MTGHDLTTADVAAADVTAADAKRELPRGALPFRRPQGLPAALAAIAVILLSQQAILASDGPLPREHSTRVEKVSTTSKREAPRFFIGKQTRKTSNQVVTADANEPTAERITTSRGTKRNTKLQWRSTRPTPRPTIQQAAHNEGPELASSSNSVLRNASAAPLPAIDPLQDPFGDRLAAQPGFDDDQDAPSTADAPSTEDKDSPSFTQTPATDQVDPYAGEPEADAEPAALAAPETLADDDATEELTPPGPSTEQERADQKYRADLARECEEGLQELRIKTLAAIDLHQRLDIAAKGTELTHFPVSCPIDDSEFTPRDWDEMYIAWTASGLCHKPLYFEEAQLERYGHSTGPYTQPAVSMAHFFGSLVVLPYSMGLKTPNECVYALGHYRPGNCAPYMLPAVPFTPRAALFQAGAVLGTISILP